MLIKIIGVIVAMSVVAVVIVAIGMWRGLIPVPGVLLSVLVRGGDPEYTARYYPADTMVYSWATLVPGEGQFDDLQKVWERFNKSRAFRDLVEMAQDDFEEETGIDFEQGVMPWIGPELSVGLLDADWEYEEWVLAGMVGVRDKKAAEGFLDDWLDYMEDEWHTEFGADTYRGFDILVSVDGAQAYALTDDWLVFATDERALEDILARVAGEEDDSLGSGDLFQEARSYLADRRFASVYLSVGEAEDLLEDLSDEMFGSEGVVWAKGDDVEWIAASMGLVESSIVMEVAAPVGIDDPLEIADLGDPSGFLPNDTLGFVAITFDPNVDRWRRALRQYELGDVFAPEDIDGLNEAIGVLADETRSLRVDGLDADDDLDVVLDLGLDAIGELTGIDLEDDLFDHLGGELIVAVGDVDVAELSQNPGGNAVDGVVMVSYLDGRKEDLGDTIDSAVGRMAAYAGVETNRLNVGADDRAVVLELDSVDDELMGYQPGYVLHDGYLTLGSTDDALEGVVGLQNGGGRTLSADEEYMRAVGWLPEKKQSLGYLDLHRIIRQVDGEDVGLSRDEYRVLEESIGAVAMSSYSPHCTDVSAAFECELPVGADVWRYTAVLTLFPE